MTGRSSSYYEQWFRAMRARTANYARLAERTGCEMYGLESEIDRFRDLDVLRTSFYFFPTRLETGLLTGRYNWRSALQRGIVGTYSDPLIEPDEEDFFPGEQRQATYEQRKRCGFSTTTEDPSAGAQTCSQLLCAEMPLEAVQDQLQSELEVVKPGVPTFHDHRRERGEVGVLLGGDAR
jgi:hypothetical protein